jgi:hypothetical protein
VKKLKIEHEAHKKKQVKHCYTSPASNPAEGKQL